MGGTAEMQAIIDDAVRRVGADRTRLMDILQDTHRGHGHLDHGDFAAIGAALGIRAAAVEDTASFYAFFNRLPRGRFHIFFSRTPVSLMKGAREVAAAFAAATGAQIGAVSPDGAFSLAWAADLGMADQEPSALVNGAAVVRLSPADAPGIVAALKGADGKASGLPLFGGDGAAQSLPQARIADSLVEPGPALFDAEATGDGLRRALERPPDEVVKEISKAKLRGRGGAGFPTGLKWKLCRQGKGDRRFVVCNADEGEPGTFKDRVLLTRAPDLVFEGMTIAAHAIGASSGVVYLRAEYAYLLASLEEKLSARRAAGRLGRNILGRSNFDFDIRIQLGAGAYVCGEESSLIESLEGKRGSPRDRPPFPTERGYLGGPTAVDNVETFACATRILERGSAWFSQFGTPESTGVKLFSVSGDCERPGVYELPFGVTLNELLDRVGASEARFVQVGGPSGECVAPKDYGRRLAYEDLSTGGSVMIFGPQRNVLETALEFTEFFAEESCGWCTPCRVGSTILAETMRKIVGGRASLEDVIAAHNLARTVKRTSRCGLGQTAPNPIVSTMRNFPERYEAALVKEDFTPRVDLNDALEESRRVQRPDKTMPEQQA